MCVFQVAPTAAPTLFGVFQVVIAEGEEEISIKICDRGGGIARDG